MRVPVAVFLAIGLFGCTEKPKPAPVAAYVPPVPVAPTDRAAACVKPPEKAAFDVAGLKSQLMVTAISCRGEDKYNAFVVRFRPELVGEEKSLNAFFGRAYGRRAQQEHDSYISQLANSQSQLSVRFGQNFCSANLALLDDVMSVKNGSDLPAFAASKPIQQAMAVEECPATPAPAAKAPVRTTKK